MTDFEKDNKSFNIMFKIITYMIGFVLLLITVYWVFIGFIAYKAVSSYDFSHGIKPVIEKIWCDKPNC